MFLADSAFFLFWVRLFRFLLQPKHVGSEVKKR